MSKKDAIIIPPCLLAPGIQAKYDINNTQWRNDFFKLFLQYNIDVFPYVCCECSFHSSHTGILRKTHGWNFYTSLEGYQNYCEKVAKTVSENILQLEKGEYCVIAVLGIEHSPSCAVNYLYTHKGTQKKAGLFIDELKLQLKNKETKIEFIGINRRYPRKALEAIEGIIIHSRGSS